MDIYSSVNNKEQVILNCDGIIDYSDLTLNDDTDNIEIDETEVPVLGVVTVDVETT